MNNKTSDKNVAEDRVIAHKFAVMQQQLEQKEKRIQELEEENTILKKASNIAKEVNIEDITDVINESCKEFMSNYIPKQAVIDVLKNNRNELFSMTYLSKEQYRPYEMQVERINKIEQELLEGGLHENRT